MTVDDPFLAEISTLECYLSSVRLCSCAETFDATLLFTLINGCHCTCLRARRHVLGLPYLLSPLLRLSSPVDGP